jgi:hypothetical protein
MLGREHREKYNHQRPRSSLGDLTLAEFARRCLASPRPFDFVKAARAPQDTVNKSNHQHDLSQRMAQTSGALQLEESPINLRLSRTIEAALYDDKDHRRITRFTHWNAGGLRAGGECDGVCAADFG